MKSIVTDLSLRFADGRLNIDGLCLAFREAVTAVDAEESTDWDTVDLEFRTLLIENPGLRTIPLPEAVNAIWDARTPETKGKDLMTRAANRARLEEVFPDYVKAQDWLFYGQGRGGIVVRAVPGDKVRDKEGNLTDQDNIRTNDEEWTKMVARKEKAAEKSAEKSKAA